MIRRVADLADQAALGTAAYVQANAKLLFFLAGIALAAYGFRLFNFDLTIDDEINAAFTGPTFLWLEQGRWGMYVLNALILPHTVIPFVPLFLALLFHTSAILLLLESWEVSSMLDRCVAGAIGMGFPVFAFMYTFSAWNFGVGIGLFCLALSVFFYRRLNPRLRLLAALPAAFAIGIYQGFLPALMAAYLADMLLNWLHGRAIGIRQLVYIAVIYALAIAAYVLVDRATLLVLGIQQSNEVTRYLTSGSVVAQLPAIAAATGTTMVSVYSGAASIYATSMWALPILLFALVSAFFLRVALSPRSLGSKLLAMLFGAVLVLLPFASGFALAGYLAMRFMVALPVAIMGFTASALDNAPRPYRYVLMALAAVCVFQFTVSTNSLFGSSELALQADRLMASRLIEDIEAAKDEANTPETKYLEVVGYYSRQSTPLMPKSETFGASFFEWDQGSAGRIVLFLQTIGYNGLQAAPLDTRIQLVPIAEAMPAWPRRGSVLAVGDTVVVKFGPYSPTQRGSICQPEQSQLRISEPNFCR